MKEQINSAIEWIKNQDVEGCITGSCLLEYFEGQDIDVFCYSLKSFTELYYAMYHNPMFCMIDKLELWKAEQFRTRESFDGNKHKGGVTTLKFMYNTCVPVNIVLKRNCDNIFSVISSFDLDIICKGFDLKTKQYLDLTNSPGKIASWNKWNPKYSNTEVWSISRILRQLDRCFKYHKRGYNTDAVVIKYISLIDELLEFESIFNSENYNEKLEITKQNTKIVRQICELWLETHEITDEQLALLQTKLKEL
jgi:hypothetical protein